MNKPIIIWEKWIDPFGKNIDEAKWTDYSNNIHNISPINPHKDQDITDDQYSQMSDNELPYNTPIDEEPVKVIVSTLGLIPYNEHTASSKIFNFWIGHSNFNISDQVKNTIEQTDGVEILDIFTRYRFRIAIGKCFKNSDVMSHINTNVYKIISEQQ
jgi:hypothetical protein